MELVGRCWLPRSWSWFISCTWITAHFDVVRQFYESDADSFIHLSVCSNHHLCLCNTDEWGIMLNCAIACIHLALKQNIYTLTCCYSVKEMWRRWTGTISETRWRDSARWRQSGKWPRLPWLSSCYTSSPGLLIQLWPLPRLLGKYTRTHVRVHAQCSHTVQTLM